jgi:hypothetical protein
MSGSRAPKLPSCLAPLALYHVSMAPLLPHETELCGNWIEIGGQVRGDAVCDRIASLTAGILDIVQDHPRSGGWVRLYRDRADGRFWERTYPQGELHGGGPPRLSWISDGAVEREYGFRP